MPLQILRNALVRFDVVAVGAVGQLFEQPLIAFAPIVFVHTLVVVSRFGDANFEEIREAKHRVGCNETAA